MDGNKDEALRCVQIAEDAIATGNKTRALKFIRIAQRLNNDLNVDALLSKCERLDSQSSASSSSSSSSSMNGSTTKKSVIDDEGLNENRNYTDENLKLIREIKLKSDYYAILGVEKSCSVEEIRKAYRKLSLKVHPDKNKAPGSEEAFKKVSKAFKCLSDDGSRRQYDQTGLVDEFEYNQQYNVPRRRRRTAGPMSRDFFEEDFDPEEIFRAFFGQSDVFGRAHVYRTRGATHHHRQEFGGGGGGGGGGGSGGLNIMLLLQLLPFLIIMLVAYLPFSEPEYSLHKNHSYPVQKTTENYGVQFFVKSEAFDHSYPEGSPARATIEDNVIKDYRSMLRRYCQIEVQRRSWNRNLPTPHCDKLQSFGVEA